jgi:signal transduction histidine kinase
MATVIPLPGDRARIHTVRMRAVNMALAVLGGCALAVAVAFHLAAGDVAGAAWTLTGPAPFYAVGLVAVLRMPDRAISSWLLAAGATFALETCLGDTMLPALRHGSWLWVLGILRVWVGTFSVVAGMGMIALFPSGLTRRPGERWLLRAGIALAAAVPVVQLLADPSVPNGMYPSEAEPTLPSPLYLPALRPVGPVADRVYQAFPLLVAAAVVVLYLRYRRSTPDERRRIRWLLFGMGGGATTSAAITALAWLATPAWFGAATLVLWPATVVLCLGSLFLALSEDGVLGIDRAARRTVVYRALWLLIGTGCLAVAALLGMLAGRYLSIGAAVLVTAAAALLVQPARRRLERLADRWVFGARLDGYAVLTRFGALLVTSPGSVDLLPRLAGAVRQGLGLRWARVRLDLDPALGPLPPVGADGIAPDDPAEPALAVPLAHAGTVIGRIECGPRRDGLLLDEDRRLLGQLADQAATAVHNLRLTTELSARLEIIRRQAAELTASRARVAQAQDAERQRIQRDLHDGVQQDVVAVSAKLALARERLSRGDPRAHESLAEVQQDLSRLLVQLREVAHGIHPPVLADQGLLEAIEAQAARLPLEVVIQAEPALRGVRYPQPVEAATWYLVAEALTNAVKHAQANQVFVAMSQPNGRLTVEVRDDGRGFDPASPRGLGLTGLADRIAIVDGTLRVDSAPGRGTALRADIPLIARETTGG